ncbi:hypothetical protein T440DRAFT_175488 [Plenodomus tracheiphilus IPT5]|uniref:Uncharacterized protein n=1 Tax=Plenodomus tracheiphilus IPT5 TaxID=1408161 RepID=A0A6A7AYE0_9PLEO|nr:hypothetical protein T440DRAFT_175488 [Plenodomus tracheiphilus IPT5]
MAGATSCQCREVLELSPPTHATPCDLPVTCPGPPAGPACPRTGGSPEPWSPGALVPRIPSPSRPKPTGSCRVASRNSAFCSFTSRPAMTSLHRHDGGELMHSTVAFMHPSFTSSMVSQLTSI